MNYSIHIIIGILLGTSLAFSANAQAAHTKPGNCAIYAQMSADTVKKDSRFEGQDGIASSLMKFAEAQSAKMEAGMEETYKASKAFGWDKAKVDAMIKENDAMMRNGFFTPTMDKSKLYMDHVQAVYACAKVQSKASDLGQSMEALTATLQKMAETIR